MKISTPFLTASMAFTLIFVASALVEAGPRCPNRAECSPPVVRDRAIKDTPQDFAANEVRNNAYPQDHTWDIRSQASGGGVPSGGSGGGVP